MESKPAMGVLISRPASKFTDGEENDRIKYAVSSMQGRHEKMEDASAAILDLDGTKSTSFFGVYDGHGGAEVALYCARQFHTELLNHPDYHDNVANAMETVFFSMDEQLQQSDEWRELVNPRGNGDRIVCLKNWTEFVKTGVCANLWPFTQETPYIGPAHEGSTACIVLIRGNQIIVGNVGDSRCVLSRNGQAIDLSTDHKPNHQLERQRILKAGGQVVRGGGVFNPQWGIVQIFEGTLSFSRAIGHFAFKQNKNLPPAEQMVTCNPDISTVNITDGTEFLVIASDAIWDCLSSQNVVDFIHQHLISGETDLRVICEALLDRCLPSSTDNMTAVLVQFKTGAGIPALSDIEAEDAAEWLRLRS